MKYAGNIFPCRLPNWCLGKYLPNSKRIYQHIIKVYTCNKGITDPHRVLLQLSQKKGAIATRTYMLSFTFPLGFLVLTITRCYTSTV